MRIAGIILSLVLVTPVVAGERDDEVPPAIADELQRDVDVAMRRAVAWLKGQQKPEGHFGQAGRVRGARQPYHHKPAYTAFALYALLKCEVAPRDPVIVRGFRYLRRAELKGVYEHAIVCMAFRELYHRQRGERAREAASAEIDQRLEGQRGGVPAAAMRRGGRIAAIDRQLVEAHAARLVGWQFRCRGWRYGDLGADDGDQDVSATHLALSGLDAAIACGVDVDERVFAGAAAFLLAQQEANGPALARLVRRQGGWAPRPGTRARGFPYMRGSTEQHERRVTGSMTAAGVLGLMLCKAELRHTPYERDLGEPVDRAIHDGLAWIHENWAEGLQSNPWGFRGTGYHWWTLSRAMTLGGLRRIGARDWYLEGAKHLVSIQRPDARRPRAMGYWDVGGEVNPSDELNTIYALLFLKRHAHRVGIPSLDRR